MSPRRFFIVGSPRSGTTLLVQMLNRHPNLHIPPETHFFTFIENYMRRHRIAPERQQGELDLAHLVDEYMGRPFYPHLGIRDPRIREVLLDGAQSYAAVFDNLMRHLLRDSGKPRWGEKTPTHLHSAERIVECFPEARFILLVRDGRAVVRSYFSVAHWTDNWYSHSRDWNRNACAGLDLQRKLSADRLLPLRYEDLVRRPDEVVPRICEFLGEEYTPRLLDAGDDSNDGGYRVYKREWMRKSGQAVDADRATAWVQEYRPAQLKLVEVLTGSQLTRLGYELRDPRSFSWPFLLARELLRDFAHRAGGKIQRSIHGELGGRSGDGPAGREA